ncbi:MAG: hypothetical protein U9R44_00775 [Candidatus Omnitrophota bacterium]|nr:hypothetical protein [Candidatus Omnitrophota bacterium]
MSNVFKKSIFMRSVSVFLVLTFAFYNVSFAAAENDFAAHGKEKFVDSALAVDDIGVAIDCGTIKSTYKGKKDKTIIHIQDAHCNYEAQQNINRILAQLVKECGVDMISVEGAKGIVDTSWFRAFPDAGIREEVANYFMKKGEITGAEFFSITSEYKGTIFGAENRDDYVKNLQAFTKTYPYKAVIEKFFLDIRTVINRLKAIVYPPKLKGLDLKIRAFKEKEVELSDFAAYLNERLMKDGISLDNYPNFGKLVDTLEYEKKIDFDIVDQERSQYIDLLGKKMSKEEMTELVTYSIRFKKGHIKAVEFYSYLRDKAKEQDIHIYQGFPNLFYYYIYTKLYEGIDNEGLFKEIDRIQAELKERLFTNDDQRNLDKYSRLIDMYISLVNIELTNDDYDLFEQYNSEVSLDEIMGFLERLCGRYNLNYHIGRVPVQISENIPNMVEFYEVAMKRDQALISNTLRQMDKDGKRLSVLITGGFHTRGIKNVLEEKNISYVVVMPKITRDVETPYIQVLTNQRTSLEDILTESVMPGAAAISVSGPKTAEKTGGDSIAPVPRIFEIVRLSFTPRGKKELWEMFRKAGLPSVEGARPFMEIAVGMKEKTIEEYIRICFTKMEEDNEKRNEEDPGIAEEKWTAFINSKNAAEVFKAEFLAILDTDSLKRVEYRDIEGRVTRATNMEIDQRRKSVGVKPAPVDTGKSGTPGVADALGRVLTDGQAEIYNGILDRSINVIKKAFMVERDDIGEGFAFVVHDGLIEAIIAENKHLPEDEKLPVNVHPGRGDTHEKLQAHIDRDIYDELTRTREGREILDTIGRHELAHLDIFNAEEMALDMEGQASQVIKDAIEKKFGKRALETWEKWVLNGKEDGKKQEDFVNNVLGYGLSSREERKIERIIDKKQREILKERKKEEEETERNIVDHAENMSRSAAEGVGPDVVIVTSSTDAQTDFWKERLTGYDDLHGSGSVIKEDAVVLSVSEAEWAAGGAGNGLGTLNGYIQAARKLWDDTDLLDEYKARNGLPSEAGNATIYQLIDAFMNFTSGKSVFMYHTAGKGTRTAPLPGAEVNSKPSIKLPEMIPVNGDIRPLTILESVLMQTGIYAPARENRLSVFWGDQVIVNELEVEKAPTHHVEIFGQMVPLDEDIKAYGVLIPEDEGDCMQREKLSMEDVRKLLPRGSNDVFKSIGSFTISNDFLTALIKMDENKKALEGRTGKLDTDPDWWQPLTSDRKTYQAMMAKKGKDAEKAGEQWDRMDALWNSFKMIEGFKEMGLRKIGYTDVGKNSLWWDYGQNKFFLRNIQILTEDSLNGRAARKFFSIDDDSWVRVSDMGKDVRVENSVIRGSTIKGGSLKNCVVIDSNLENVYAEDAVIIGSTIIKREEVSGTVLTADGGLIYNVVDEDASVSKGQVLTNVFHPKLGRIPMRTDVTRDGQADWKGEVFVYDNQYTYGDINELMKKDITIEDVEKIKQEYIDLALGHRLEAVNPAELAKGLFKNRNKKAGELEKKAAEKKNKEARNIRQQAEKARMKSLAEARQEIAYRMIMFGDFSHLIMMTDADVAKYAEMFKVSLKRAETELKLVKTRVELSRIDRKKRFESKVPAAFGTSGIRGRVPEWLLEGEDRNTGLTDNEVYTDTRGYIKYLLAEGVVAKPDLEGFTRNTFTIAGDLRRDHTERIMAAVGRAIEDEWRESAPEVEGREVPLELDWAGKIPTPAAAYRAAQKKSILVMVTGSHIEFNMNGIKFYLEDGEELLKEHEKAVLQYVEKAKKDEFSLSWEESLFDVNGMFKTAPAYNFTANEKKAIKDYVKRYTAVFPPDMLKGQKIVFWKHIAVGRDIIHRIFEELGAEVHERERTDEYVKIDTEMVTPEMAEKLDGFSRSVLVKDIVQEIFSICFTDGDSDRPGVADEKGKFLTGDKLGLLTAKLLLSEMPGDETLVVAVPVSTNIGVINALKAMHPRVKLILTDVGSPHVVKAMNDAEALAREAGKKVRTLGWEANGGFLLGSEFRVRGRRTLTRLATRDAVLPMLGAYFLDKIKGMKLSRLFKTELPEEVTHSVGYKAVNFEEDFGLSFDEANALKVKMVGLITPQLKKNPTLDGKKDRVVQVDFDDEGKAVKVYRRKQAWIKGRRKFEFDKKGKETDLFEVEEKDISEVYEKGDRDLAEWERVKNRLQGMFGAEGFGKIASINILAGTQVIFENGEVSHLRPSGNEPVFRNYACSKKEARSKEISAIGLTRIIPNLAAAALKEAQRAVTPGVYTMSGQSSLDKAISQARETKYYKPLGVTEKADHETALAELDRRITAGEFFKTKIYFRLGIDNYTWGERLEGSTILELMGKITTEEKVEVVVANLTLEQEQKLVADYYKRKYSDDVPLEVKETDKDKFEKFIRDKIRKEVVSERWISAGMIDLGPDFADLPLEALAYWPEEIYGREHLREFGAENLITAKHLTAGLPLSVQYHEFSEMIIPIENGEILLGLKQDMTKEQVKLELQKGNTGIFNTVKVEKGRPLIVPANTFHAYLGGIRVIEVKAVDAAGDSKGTRSLYDRLKWETETFWRKNLEMWNAMREKLGKPKFKNPKEIKEFANMILEEINAARAEGKDVTKYIKQLTDMKFVRKGKDFLTMDENEIKKILDNANLKATDISRIYDGIVPEEFTGKERDRATLEIMGVAQGEFISGRYVIPERLSMDSDSIVTGRLHSLLVAEGKVKITTPKTSIILEQGAEIPVYADMGAYNIKSLEGKAVVYAQIRPLPETRPFPVVEGRDMPGKDAVTGLRDYEVRGLSSDFGPEVLPGTSDELTLNTGKPVQMSSVKGMGIVGEREHTLLVQDGEVAVLKSGEETPVVLAQGAELTLTGLDYTIQKISDKAATVKIDYEKTDSEKAVYAVYETVKKHVSAIREKQVDLILPQEMFVRGGTGTPGSAEWVERQINRFFDQRDMIKIRTYDSSTKGRGLDEQVTRMKIRSEAVAVLGATEANIESVDKEADAVKKAELERFLNKTRIMALPNLDPEELEDQGWLFNMEIAGIALLQAVLDVDMIRNETAIAEDMRKLMDQLTPPEIEVKMNDLYYLLPFTDVTGAENLPVVFEEKNSLQWMMHLLQKLLLKMPIKPFRPEAQLEQRRKVMWSV